MSDESMAAWIARSSERLGTQRQRSRTERHILLRLSLADYCSLVGLAFAWGATVLLLSGEPNWAIVAVTGGFAFDKLDGYVARQYGCQSDVGREIDAFLDVFVYLVTASVLFHTSISPHPAVSVVVGFLIIAVGGLRLLRFTNEGFVVEDGTSYYRGITVIHTALLVLGNYTVGQSHGRSETEYPSAVWRFTSIRYSIISVRQYTSWWRSARGTAGSPPGPSSPPARSCFRITTAQRP